MSAAQSATIEALLSLPFGDASRLALANSIENGLPVAAVDSLADALAPNDVQFKFRLISKATLNRRRKSPSKRLTTPESERMARIAEVFSFAVDTYKSIEQARDFLTRPHSMLDGTPPLDVALESGPGAELVINLLGRAAFGGGA